MKLWAFQNRRANPSSYKSSRIRFIPRDESHGPISCPPPKKNTSLTFPFPPSPLAFCQRLLYISRPLKPVSHAPAPPLDQTHFNIRCRRGWLQPSRIIVPPLPGGVSCCCRCGETTTDDDDVGGPTAASSSSSRRRRRRRSSLSFAVVLAVVRTQAGFDLGD